MDYNFKRINGTDAIDMKNLNDNFKYIFMKLFEEAPKKPVTVEKQVKEKEGEISPYKLELSNGSYVSVYKSGIRIAFNDGNFITVEKDCVSFYMGENGLLGIPSWILKPDGLYNKDEKNVLDTNGLVIHPTFY